MDWSLRRQIFYLGILGAFVFVFAFWIIYPTFNKAPSCIDNAQNGDETGVDCGGSCVKVCTKDADDVSILWSRSFQVVPGRYNAVAYVLNHNANAVIDKINYRFRFADKDNIYIGKRDGTTYIPPSGNFAIFEPAIDLGGSVPVYTTLEFTSVPEWTQVTTDKVNQLKILVSNIRLEDEAVSPHLFATVKNNSLLSISEISVVAILYDTSHNAVSASSTYLDKLSGEEIRDISFTWPEPITTPVVAKEIIPIFNISNVK